MDERVVLDFAVPLGVGEVLACPPEKEVHLARAVHLLEALATLLDVAPLFGRRNDFNEALDQLALFVVEDMGGRLLQLTDTRVLILPPGIEGIRGVEDAAETVRSEGDGRRW